MISLKDVLEFVYYATFLGRVYALDLLDWFKSLKTIEHLLLPIQKMAQHCITSENEAIQNDKLYNDKWFSSFSECIISEYYHKLNLLKFLDFS